MKSQRKKHREKLNIIMIKKERTLKTKLSKERVKGNRSKHSIKLTRNRATEIVQTRSR